MSWIINGELLDPVSAVCSVIGKSIVDFMLFLTAFWPLASTARPAWLENCKYQSDWRDLLPNRRDLICTPKIGGDKNLKGYVAAAANVPESQRNPSRI
jgi:hypothetical protein